MGESETVEKLRTNLWDEENRLRAVDITPDAEGVRPIAIYTYDAGGERILKHSNTSVSIYLNGKKVADTIQVDATIYPSGMLVARVIPSEDEESTGGLGYTKHYYAGTQRVSSKIGTTENLGDFLQDWYTGGTGGPVDVVGSSHGVLANAEEGVVQVYTELGIDPPTYESDPVFIPVASFIHGDDEIEHYFFHPDHLGSTSYITNLAGEVSQHMEYFAFGETFVEEHRSSNNSPYKFNGKELDEETGWYYYGARYYSARESFWLSVDPLANVDYIMNKEAYINGEHNGGIFNSFNHNSYGYCYQNPLIYFDPNGKQSLATGESTAIGVLMNNEKIQHEYVYVRKTTDKNKVSAMATAYWNVMSGQFHLALDVVGLVPIAGEVADGVNGFIYLIEGDYLNAGLSFAAMIPFAGWVATGSKLGLKIGKETIQNAGDYYSAVNKLSPGERVATHRSVFKEIAEENGWEKANSSIIKKNPDHKNIYKDKNDTYYSLDSENGHIEIINSKGKHQGSIDFTGKATKGPDRKGKHDLNIK